MHHGIGVVAVVATAYKVQEAVTVAVCATVGPRTVAVLIDPVARFGRHGVDPVICIVAIERQSHCGAFFVCPAVLIRVLGHVHKAIAVGILTVT